MYVTSQSFYKNSLMRKNTAYRCTNFVSSKKGFFDLKK